MSQDLILGCQHWSALGISQIDKLKKILNKEKDLFGIQKIF